METNTIILPSLLHWFPVEEALQKMKNLLNDDGMLNGYGYIFRSLRDSEGEEREDYNKIFDVFYGKVSKYFAFNRDELLDHYRDKDRYPFEKMFKI